MLPQDWSIHFRSDGLGLSPAEYTRLLARLAEGEGIAADEFSLGGVVERLERRMAELLGKEVAVFMPSGTLANHLALRLLGQRGRRVLVQRESHIYRDCGDCAQELSGLTLVPLATAIGCTVHVLGDMLTDSGCMLAFPLSRHRFHLLPEPLAFTTGTSPEILFVDPVLTGALLVLGGFVVDPGFVTAHWHSFTQAAAR